MGSPGSGTPHHPAALSQAWAAAAAPPTQSPSCPSPFTGVSPALWSEGPPHIPTSSSLLHSPYRCFLNMSFACLVLSWHLPLRNPNWHSPLLFPAVIPRQVPL